MPREYTFKIDYTATSSDAEIFPQVTFAEVPEGSIVADLLTVTDSDVPEEGNMVLANIVAPQFPLTLTPEFSLSDGATLEGNGTTPYEFGSADERHSFTVVARDGTEKRWTFGLAVLPVVNANSAEVDEAALALTNLAGFSAEPGSKGFSIEEHRFSASTGVAGTGTAATSEPAKTAALSGKGGNALQKATIRHGRPAEADTPTADTLKLYINTSSGTPFPISIDMAIPLPDGVSLVGDVSDMSFPDIGSEHTFWLLDTVDGIARRWIVALEEYNSPVATVLDFSYEYTASEVRENSLSDPKVPAIVMDADRTADIDHMTSPAGHRIRNEQERFERPSTRIARRRELDKLERASQDKSVTVVGLRLFLNERGLAKVVIGLARGRKRYDKREYIKEKDARREMDRAMKR